MSNYYNEAGEPLMDGAAMRYEMYLDSLYEPDPDEFYDRWSEAPHEIDLDDRDEDGVPWCYGCDDYARDCEEHPEYSNNR